MQHNSGMTFYHINRKKNNVMCTITFIPESDPAVTHQTLVSYSHDGLASSYPYPFAWIPSIISDTHWWDFDLWSNGQCVAMKDNKISDSQVPNLFHWPYKWPTLIKLIPSKKMIITAKYIENLIISSRLFHTIALKWDSIVVNQKIVDGI